MGVSSSSNNPVKSTLNQLTQNDYSHDTSFWSNLHDHSSELSVGGLLWYPSIMHQIAQKYPKNLVKLMTFCDSYIKAIPDKGTIKTNDDKALICNKLSMACQVFTCASSVILTSQSYSSLINTIKPSIPVFQADILKYFKTGYLSGIDENGKIGNQSNFIQIRNVIVHSLLCTVNLSYFSRFIENPPMLESSIPDFPTTLFYNMLCSLEDKDPDQITLLNNSVALSAKMNPGIVQAIQMIDPHLLANFFELNHIDQYSLTFLFQCLLNNKPFIKEIASSGRSNLLIFKILNYSQLKVESVGISFMHTLAACSIQLILEEKDAAYQLNDNFALEFTSKFQPQQGTFADVLIEVLFNTCNSSSLIPIFTEIFKLISPYVSQLSVFVSVKLIDVLQNILQGINHENKNYSAQQLLEAFATIIQRTDGNDYFRIIIAQRTATFQFLKTMKSLQSSAINVIQKYLNAIRQIVLKMHSQKVDLSEINKAVLDINIEELFPNVVEFSVEPFTFTGRIESAWSEWCEVLFLQCFKAEFDLIKQYDANSTR